MLSQLASHHRIPIVYCNAVGGNDQLIFDGNSLAIGADGSLRTKLAAIRRRPRRHRHRKRPRADHLSGFKTEPEELFTTRSASALRDYLSKCGFKSAVLGLSGGIDSAVTAALAVHALGPENVLGVHHADAVSSAGSIDDSRALAHNLGIRCLHIPIQRSFEVFREQFREIFAGLPEDTTEENMQPRLRGMTLMALSNKFGHPAADHRQQERTRRRLLHALRRHVRRAWR